MNWKKIVMGIAVLLGLWLVACLVIHFIWKLILFILPLAVVVAVAYWGWKQIKKWGKT